MSLFLHDVSFDYLSVTAPAGQLNRFRPELNARKSTKWLLENWSWAHRTRQGKRTCHDLVVIRRRLVQVHHLLWWGQVDLLLSTHFPRFRFSSDDQPVTVWLFSSDWESGVGYSDRSQPSVSSALVWDRGVTSCSKWRRIAWKSKRTSSESSSKLSNEQWRQSRNFFIIFINV